MLLKKIFVGKYDMVYYNSVKCFCDFSLRMDQSLVAVHLAVSFLIGNPIFS